jgi:hypothetical protein
MALQPFTARIGPTVSEIAQVLEMRRDQPNEGLLKTFGMARMIHMRTLSRVARRVVKR